jgi:regulator of sigma E protease
MEFLNAIPIIGPFLAVIIPFILVLSVVVAIHELGHLLVGRWRGIKAEVYSIGFGKVLWSRYDKYGTRWQVAALPLGGFVKFVGDMDPASAGKADDSELTPEDRKQAFHNASLLSRTLTVLAGPVANFILSICIFAGLALHSGKSSEEPVVAAIGETKLEEVGFQPGDRVVQVGDRKIDAFNEIINELSISNGAPTTAVVIRDGVEQEITTRYMLPPRITGVTPDGAAAASGVIPGDIIRKIGDDDINSSRDVQLAVADLPHNEEITFTLEREDELVEIAFTPKLVERAHPRTGEIQKIPFLGIRMQELGGLTAENVPVSFLEAGEYGVHQVWRIIRDTVVFVNEMLFNGASTDQLSGPIGIAKFSGDAAEQGFVALIGLVAFLSTAVGLFNLFPIPILDGGHLMFYFFEMLRGRPVGEIWMRYGTMLGLSLVLLLMVFVTYNDFMKL